jgi:hypothetical protein
MPCTEPSDAGYRTQPAQRDAHTATTTVATHAVFERGITRTGSKMRNSASMQQAGEHDDDHGQRQPQQIGTGEIRDVGEPARPHRLACVLREGGHRNDDAVEAHPKDFVGER